MIACLDPALLSPLVTLFIGGVAAYIGFLQWRLAERKLKYDLFDRRYKIYDATRKFLSAILQKATFDDRDIFEYYAGISDADFLYPKELRDYLDTIKNRAFAMRAHEMDFRDLPVSEARTELVKKMHVELKWLNDQLTELRTRFHPYLGFRTIK